MLYFLNTNCKNCLLQGESLLIGEALISNNEIYNLTVNLKGNICVYNVNTNTKKWCSGYVSPVAWKMIITESGQFSIIKTNGISIWSPKSPITSVMNNVQYVILSNNGNFIVYSNSGIAWSCNRGTFSRSIYSTCGITSSLESIDDTCNTPTATPTATPTRAPTASSSPTRSPTRKPTTNARSPTMKPTSASKKPPTAVPTIA